MMFFLFLVSLPVIILFLLHKAKISRNVILPPGPFGLPIIGNLHQYDSLAPHVYFWKLSKKYGKIFSLNLGSSPIVVISSAKLAKEVMKTQDLVFCSRPSTFCQQKLSYNSHDIVFSPYNDYWREIRKLCVLDLFSLKKVQSFSPIREDEVSRMIKKISQQALLLVLGSMKKHTKGGDLMKRRFDELIHETQQILSSFFVSDFFPSLSWIDKLTGMANRLEKNFKYLDEFYEELIEQHHNPNRPKSMEGDIIDLLLQWKKEQSTQTNFTLDNIKAILMNIIVAGTDTSAITVIWAMTALIKHPKVMKKVQAEIRESVGRKGIVNEDDTQNMPYLKAVIKETFRLYPTAPVLVARETMENSILEGYKIPPKTTIRVNYWAMARDPEYWKNPEEFILTDS
ncbi:hypothetical protein P3S68_023836 [Capsicum galapagoense]